MVNFISNTFFTASFPDPNEQLVESGIFSTYDFADLSDVLSLSTSELEAIWEIMPLEMVQSGQFSSKNAQIVKSQWINQCHFNLLKS